ncbi:hypothetical protein pqer_cds_490 [Pandoravirus quercus]|uniref:DUF5865 domain-containing protein n=2 Tax=Pandoravirus TaxID=2060084 RepID=A0A2U7U946_9VIRU|nr:hypothetical protein pqer_cds_490 [Pandoravirus quercus]AVK74912.1 hypothetical protein pqer_cds_490 [Pandoravirus quercus]QBZ81098.1 PRK00708 superfamily incomplete domain containing protein [Pandoravirus celtis]
MSSSTAQPADAKDAQLQSTLLDFATKLQEIIASLAVVPPPATPTADVAPAEPVDAPADDAPATPTVAPAPRPFAHMPTFTPKGCYKATPGVLARAKWIYDCEEEGSAGYMTVAQFAERLAALPTTARVSTGSDLRAKVVRVYLDRHYSITAARDSGCGHKYTTTEVSLSDVDTASPSTAFNAVELAGPPVEAGWLARKLVNYARDAPDALALVAGSLAALPSAVKCVGIVSADVPVPVTLSCPQWRIGCGIASPFDEAKQNELDAVVRRAKALARCGGRDRLGEIASYVATAMAGCGLAAFDLFYVPHAQTRAVAAHHVWGDLLTRAEFAEAYERRIVTERQIQRFYRPVAPSDPAVPVNPMARILDAGVDNVADLLDLVDDRMLCL